MTLTVASSGSATRVSAGRRSHFVNGLIAARAAPDGRYALPNNEMAVHHLNGNTERRLLATVAELRAALEGTFRLTLPEAPELDEALGRLIAPSA